MLILLVQLLKKFLFYKVGFNKYTITQWCIGPGEGRPTRIICWWGVWPKVWNSNPYLRIFLPQEMADLMLFWNFCKSGHSSNGFSTSKMADLQFFHNFCEMGPSSKDFFTKWDPGVRSFGEKVTHLGGTSLYILTFEYPPVYGHSVDDAVHTRCMKWHVKLSNQIWKQKLQQSMVEPVCC